MQLTNAFSDCVVWFELVAGWHSGAATSTRNNRGNNNNNNNELNKTSDTNATNAIKRRQCVKLSVRISKCIFHFPRISTFPYMQPCNADADAQLQRPAAGWQNKEAAHTHPPHIPPTHTLTVARTKAKPRQTRPCGRPYRRGSVYNLRFMSAMLTVREKRWERGRTVGWASNCNTCCASSNAADKHLRTHTYAHAHTLIDSHTHAVKHAAELAQCVKCHICVALINSLKCFNAPAGIIKCSGTGKQQIYSQPRSTLSLHSSCLPSRISFT